MFHMHNMEGMLLQISVSACASSSVFSSWRAQVSHRMTTVSLGITIHLNLRSSFLGRHSRRSAAQPLPSHRYGCALMAALQQGWWVSMRQAISDLVCLSVFSTPEFLPVDSTAWVSPKRGNMGDMCRCKWDDWLWFLRALCLVGWSWCKEKEKTKTYN